MTSSSDDPFAAAAAFFGTAASSAPTLPAPSTTKGLRGRAGLGSKPAPAQKTPADDKLLRVGKKRRQEESDDESLGSSSDESDDEVGRLDLIGTATKAAPVAPSAPPAAPPADAKKPKKLDKKARERLKQQQEEEEPAEPEPEPEQPKEKRKRKKVRSRQKNIYKDKRILDGTLPDHLVRKAGSGLKTKARPLTPETKARLIAKGAKGKEKAAAKAEAAPVDLVAEAARKEKAKEIKAKLLKETSGFANLEKKKKKKKKVEKEKMEAPTWGT
jgi:hypothetical protein